MRIPIEFMQSKYLIPIASWGALGFYRGVKECYNVGRSDMYSDMLLFGFVGTIIYLVPPFIPLAIHNELYLLEKSFRKL